MSYIAETLMTEPEIRLRRLSLQIRKWMAQQARRLTAVEILEKFGEDAPLRFMEKKEGSVAYDEDTYLWSLTPTPENVEMADTELAKWSLGEDKVE
jgi:hypothetical protein